MKSTPFWWRILCKNLYSDSGRGVPMDVSVVTKAWSTHTSTTESVNYLVRLLLVVEFPGLLECAQRLGVDIGSLLSVSKVEAIEDKDTADAQVLKSLQLSLDVILQCKGKPAECD